MDSEIVVAAIAGATTIAAAIVTGLFAVGAQRRSGSDSAKNNILEPNGILEPSTSRSVRTANEARVFLHIKDEAQRVDAHRLKTKLIDNGFTVMRIVRHESGPDAQIVYWNEHDANEAESLARLTEEALRSASVETIARISPGVSRSYEVWLPALQPRP